MSLIVAVKDNERIVIGSDKQASANGNKEHNATKI
jgi:ATP-dependent protease HslVU (ClpYQ) peptidase subunit